MDDVIRPGQYVVIQKVGGEHVRVMRTNKGQKILIEKLKFTADSLLGKPYGLFEVVGGQASPVSAQKLVEVDGSGDIELRGDLKAESNGSSKEETDEGIKSEPKDQGFVDNFDQNEQNEAQARQALTQDEVIDLKNEGISAKELVAKLVEGNKAFTSRTVYSQSKYIRRKTKKHSDRVLVLKPTIRLLTQSYYFKDADRFGNLRIDQLGMLLQMGHVVQSRHVLVFDQVLGIVTSAVLERLGGNGACIHIHRGLIAQSIPCVHSMNYDEEVLAPFLPVRISKILGTDEPMEESGAADVAGDEEEVSKEVSSTEDSNVRRAERLAREQRALGFLAQGVDCLVIASRSVDVVSVLEVFYPKLRPAGAVAIYHPDLPTIIRAQCWLMEHNALNVSFSEQMYRVHQVLPDRTHPLMAQHVAGGYVLSAIKVLPSSSQ